MASLSLPVRTRYAALALTLLLAAAADATVIRFNSNLGSFDVRLYETATPLTTANMLSYVNDGDYDNSIIHRSEVNTYFQQSDGTFTTDPFVIQGGNSSFDQNGLLDFIPQDDPVMNEPGISNLRGTIALAKRSTGPDPENSGTNNWFINLDNNTFLDSPTNNGGFTAFGRVVHDGMDIVDTIANLPTHEIAATVDGQLVLIGSVVPMHGDFSNGVTQDNFVLFSTIEELNIPDGDFDFDGDVDLADLAILQRDFGSTTEVAADANGDAVVDQLDLAIWEQDYGIGEAALSFVGVPEPAAAALVATAAILLLRRKRF
ncbi:MAG: peptidylprolyl isomerase [Planctomycetota bacterium]